MRTPLEGTIRMSGVFASEWAEEHWGDGLLVAFHSSHPRDPTALHRGSRMLYPDSVRIRPRPLAKRVRVGLYRPDDPTWVPG